MTDSPTLPAASSIWMRGYLPNGRMLSITALPTDDFASIIARAIALDAAMVAAGLSVHEPGLNEGEQRESIAYVVRRAKLNDDGSETPVIDLYPEKLSFKFLTIYLNTKDDEHAFERATGLKLTDIPYCNFKAAIERGKDGKDDLNYVRALPAATGLIWKNNPRWEGENDKKHPKRLFVRWADIAAAPAPAAESAPELRVVEKPATPKGGNDALVSLKMRVLKDIDKTLTDAQIAILGEVPAFGDLDSWRSKHGTLDKAFAAIKANYEFEKLGDLATVDF